jgi:hypothetical protein
MIHEKIKKLLEREGYTFSVYKMKEVVRYVYHKGDIVGSLDVDKEGDRYSLSLNYRLKNLDKQSSYRSNFPLKELDSNFKGFLCENLKLDNHPWLNVDGAFLSGRKKIDLGVSVVKIEGNVR